MQEVLDDAWSVDRLPVDSVLADADGFIFQVQYPPAEPGSHASLAGIEGMGYTNSQVGVRYPATLLRRGGGGTVSTEES